MRKELQIFSKNPTSSILLIGNKGLDQETDALELAACLLGTTEKKLFSHPDFLFISCGKDKSIGVEQSEAILRKAMFLPSLADRIVIIVSEFDKMTVQAQNKLLKLIEESKHVLIIGTAYSENVLSTIKSRVRKIVYYPYSYEEFQKYCTQKHLDDAHVLFYLTGGCPGLLTDNTKALTIFKDVLDSIRTGHSLKLLQILHLAEEKDSENFYSCFPGLVKNLFSMMYAAFTMQYAEQCSQNSTKQQVTYKILQTMESHMANCHSSAYTKDNFFMCIAGIIELKGGQ